VPGAVILPRVPGMNRQPDAVGRRLALVGRRDSLLTGTTVGLAGRTRPRGYPPHYENGVGLTKAFPIRATVPGSGQVPPRPAFGVPATTPSPAHGHDHLSRDASRANQQRNLQHPKAGRARADPASAAPSTALCLQSGRYGPRCFPQPAAAFYPALVTLTSCVSRARKVYPMPMFNCRNVNSCTACMQ